MNNTLSHQEQTLPMLCINMLNKLHFTISVSSLEPHYKAKVIDIVSSDEPAANLSRHAVMMAVVVVSK